MRLLVFFFLYFAFSTENVNGAVNDTLEMELESNITVVKLEHGLKFQAHSEFGLPDNMTDLFNSTAADSEGATNSSLPVDLEHSRARRSNKDGEISAAKTMTRKVTIKKGTTKKVTTKKPVIVMVKPKTPKNGTTKKVTTKKGDQVVWKPSKKTTKKQQKKTTKRKTTKRQTTKKQTTTTVTTTRRPTPQHVIPGQVLGKLVDFWNEWLQYIEQKQTADKRDPSSRPQTEVRPGWNQPTPPGQPQTTTRRIFVMYDDEDVEKKNPNKKNDNDGPNRFVMRSS